VRFAGVIVVERDREFDAPERLPAPGEIPLASSACFEN
jgi:hypothetical protein